MTEIEGGDIYPAPLNLPQNEKDPIEFETAKGCVAHYASIASKSIIEYHGLASTKNLAASASTMCSKLRRLAADSFTANSSEEWASKLAGGTNGSLTIGNLLIARNIVRTILRYDSKLSAGEATNIPGTLSHTGLRKLENGLTISIAGIMTNLNPQGNIRAFKPYLHNEGDIYNTLIRDIIRHSDLESADFAAINDWLHHGDKRR